MRRGLSALAATLLGTALIVVGHPLLALAGCTPGGHYDPLTNTYVGAVMCPGAPGGDGGGQTDPPSRGHDPSEAGSGPSGNDHGGGGDGNDPGGSQIGVPVGLGGQRCVGAITAAAAPLPPAGNPAWAGHSPADTTGQLMHCEGDLNGVAFNFWQAGGTAAPPPPPPPNREALAAQAMLSLKAKLQITSLPMHFGPDAQRIAVNGWTWLWADDPGVLTATSPVDRGISVTVTARMTSVSWSPGEPTKCVVHQSECSGDKVAPVVCQGAGTAPQQGTSSRVQPPCGYMFRWMSTVGRTGGKHAWMVTATPTWDLRWQANGTGPASGATTGGETQPGLARATPVTVGEWSTRIVCTPGVDPDCSGG